MPEKVAEHVSPDTSRRRPRHDGSAQVMEPHVLEPGERRDTDEVLTAPSGRSRQRPAPC